MVFVRAVESGRRFRDFFNFIANDPRVTSGFQNELRARAFYAQSKEAHRALYDAVDADFKARGVDTLFDQDYSFFSDRVYHLFPRAVNEGGVDLNEATALAQQLLDISRDYTMAAGEAREKLGIRYPLPLLTKVLPWLDFPNYAQLETSRDKNAVFVDGIDKVRAESSGLKLTTLFDFVSPSGKIFVIDHKENLGRFLFGLISENTGRGYPFRNVYERGVQFGFDYFVGDYSERDFQPHQNAIMTFLNRKGRRPFVRLKRDGDFWLMKIDKNREGWNPED